MANRPYFRCGIEELQTLAEKAVSDPKLRRDLLAELDIRKSRGAKKLKESLKQQGEVTATNAPPPSRTKQPLVQTASRKNARQHKNPIKKKQTNSGKTKKNYHQRNPLRSATTNLGTDDDGPLVTQEVSDPIDNLINAMRLEIISAKKASISSEVTLTGGTKIESVTDRHVYRFIIELDVSIQEDSPVEVVTTSQAADGTVIAIQDRSILIALKEDLGDFIPSASIRQDSTYLIKLLCEKFKAIKSGKNTSFRMGMIKKILGEEESIYSKEEPPSGLDLQSLNRSQYEALRLAMGSEIAWIWGPPGCGKSHTLVPIIEAFFKQGQRILVCSNTNRAVDALLVKLCQRLSESGDDAFQKGAVIRQGQIVDEKLLPFAPQIDLEQIVERLGKGLRQEKQALERQLNDIDHRMGPYQRSLETFSQLDRVALELVNAQSNLNTAKQMVSKHQSDEERIGFDIKQLSLDAARKKENVGFFNTLSEAFGAKTHQEIEQEINNLNAARVKATTAINNSFSEMEKVKLHFDEIQKKNDALIQSVKGQNRQQIIQWVQKLNEDERRKTDSIKALRSQSKDFRYKEGCCQKFTNHSRYHDQDVHGFR